MLVAVEDLESLVETIAVLSDRETVRALADADAELAEGKGEDEARLRARRQLSETLPESIAFATFEFIVGPLLDHPLRVGKRLRAPPEDRYSARRGTYRV